MPIENAETPARERELMSAESDLKYITDLNQNPAFTKYFKRRLKEKQSDLAKRILEEKMTAEARQQLHEKYEVYKEILEMPAIDEVNAQKTLNSKS